MLQRKRNSLTSVTLIVAVRKCMAERLEKSIRSHGLHKALKGPDGQTIIGITSEPNFQDQGIYWGYLQSIGEVLLTAA